MLTVLRIIVIIVSLLAFVIVLELIRRGRLREEHSLIWLFSAGMVFLLALFRGLLRTLADFFQIEYAPSFLFMVAIGLIILIQLFHAISISSLTSKSRDVAQKIAILELQLEKLSTQVSQVTGFNLANSPIQYLQSISNELSTSKDLNAFMQRSLEIAKEGIGATSGCLLAFDTEENFLRSFSSPPDENKNLGEAYFFDIIENGLAGWVLKNRQPILLSNTLSDARWLQRSEEDKSTEPRSAMCIPVNISDNVIGIFTFVHSQTESFSEHNLALLASISAVVSSTGKELFSSGFDTNA